MAQKKLKAHEEETLQSIQKTIGYGQTFTAQSLNSILYISLSTIRRHLGALEANKLVTKTKNGDTYEYQLIAQEITV